MAIIEKFIKINCMMIRIQQWRALI